ncbi:putative rRNA-processing protein EBP2 like [Pseudolycoriella hygida]|uniref:rRNA-processing protein EBP2 like n=1 Tax=Pseudolycoriella hygida TaxID=35572 RepID=A0A9Q0RZQ1_9DIPT|nr:putative rRNA-processing protein EBP2 like [Pseudolycoriella hygida]
MPDFDMKSSDSEIDMDSDDELREAYARGDLKPGLNVEVVKTKPTVNNIIRIQQKLNQIEQKFPWIERLDMTNEPAPVAPEIAVQFAKHEQKRANLFAGNKKIQAFTAEEDPVLNDFKREMLFHRQAQSAVVEGIKRLHELGITTKRPDDYFAEMAKTDEHMQKVRSNLIAKQEGQAKSERIKQIREQRKMGKMVQRQARVQRDAEKREMLDKLKKFRKGKLQNLDFLDDNKSGQSKRDGKKAAKDKRNARDKRFGFGGKKRGLKRNTKQSSMEGGGDHKSKYKNSKNGPKGAGRGGKKGSAPRAGKSKRVKSKARGRK